MSTVTWPIYSAVEIIDDTPWWVVWERRLMPRKPHLD